MEYMTGRKGKYGINSSVAYHGITANPEQVLRRMVTTICPELEENILHNYKPVVNTDDVALVSLEEEGNVLFTVIWHRTYCKGLFR